MSPPSILRVLVVEDSITVRERICEVLASDPAVAVVGEAADGRRAVELCDKLRPDVISMDIVLPIMSGVAATEEIMAHFATPILIVSSSTNRGEVFGTYEALSAGAVDVLEKPNFDDAPGAWEHRYLSALKMVARIPVITHPKAKLDGRRTVRPTPKPPLPLVDKSRAIGIVVLGASTGGPAALVEVLRAIPAPIGVPLAFVLHIGELFALDFGTWLAAQIGHRVVGATDGLDVASTTGSVVMAPPRFHLAIEGGRFRLVDAPERHSCKPSIDVLFASVAREYGAKATACLLTGMGRDGAAGLFDVRAAGGATIAQDEATSVVFGMPREAIRLGAAERVLPVGEIGGALREWTRGAGR